MSFQVKIISPDGRLPKRGSASAAGYDLFASTTLTVHPNSRVLVPTGISIAIPEGTYGRVAPRSGLALKYGIDVGAGVVDSDYRGPLGVVLFNHSERPFLIATGDRIAQIILEKIITPEVVEVEELSETVRGEGGFGSTGVN